jgi:hypothetical protein
MTVACIIPVTICILLRRQVTVGYWWAMTQPGRRVRALRTVDRSIERNSGAKARALQHVLKKSRREMTCVSMSDTDTLLEFGLRSEECVNGTREAEGIICRVVNDVDERT